MEALEESATVTLTCVRCTRSNRVERSRLAQALCGGCHAPLSDAATARKRLARLQTRDYEHAIDRKALETLQRTAGLELAVRKFNEFGLDRLIKVEFTGSHLQITERNLPEIYRLFREACSIMAMPAVPRLYVSAEDGINAVTAGVEESIVCLTAGAVEKLDSDELLWIMGHELGHLRSNHILYKQMASVLPYMGQLIGKFTVNIGEILTYGLQAALLYWDRVSEYSADRAGLLTCQNQRAAITALIKLAGLPPNHYDQIDVRSFLTQAREFQDFDQDVLMTCAKAFGIRSKDHPWTVTRAAELLKWTESGEYERVLKAAG